ncbi:hypothetical protein ACS5NO_32055 [Larkinella sp. GY13]|uniref:hypothetical protein n=1 Tax=Larkinella sp. GY13 TaxID=3453720 RepID=UPI003EEC6FD0
MNTPILDAFNAYQSKLSEFAQTIKAQVRAKSSLKRVQEGLGITASMYYQRLNYPQNISIDEVNALSRLVDNDILTQKHTEAVELGKQIAGCINQGLEDAEIPITFLCKKLGTDTSSFYRKQKDPRLWSQTEVERISHIVETIKSL